MIVNKPGFQTGSYVANIQSGVLAATLAADSPIWGIRCGPTQTAVAPTGGIIVQPRFIYITEIGFSLSSIVAFTAAQQFGFYLERFSGANLAGGTDGLIMKVNGTATANPPNSVATPGGPEGGDVRNSSTATLTSAGVTFDGKKIPFYGWSTVGPQSLPYVTVSFPDNPLKLGLGEGLAIRNTIVWPAAGTGVAVGYCKFDERSV